MPYQGPKPGSERRVICAVAGLCLAFGAVAARAQAAPPGTTPAPVVDSAPAGPVSPPPAAAPVIDAAVESSPASGTPRGVYLPAHVEITVRLQQAIDSAHERNGDMLNAALAAPVRTSDGRTLAAGTRVGVTVLAVAPAGKLQSQGELTLQVTHVGPVGVLTDAQTFFGQEGHKDLPDSAPAKGTEASVAADVVLRFHVSEQPR